MKSLSTDERFAKVEENCSPIIRTRVENARKIQRKRFGEFSIPCNAAIPGGHVEDYCKFSENGFQSFKTTIDKNSLTTRNMDRLAKVARTIADLSNRQEIDPEHIEEASTFVIGGILRESFK